MAATKLCNLTPGDWIAIADILVTTAIGIWIACLVQNNITKNRYLKECFIKELDSIGDLYKNFMNEIYAGKCSSTFIKDWLKIMSIRISSFDEFLHKSYNVSDSLLLDHHSELQKFITGTEEFNDNYRKDKCEFIGNTKTELLKKHSELRRTLIQRVIDINKAKKNKGC